MHQRTREKFSVIATHNHLRAASRSIIITSHLDPELTETAPGAVREAGPGIIPPFISDVTTVSASLPCDKEKYFREWRRSSSRDNVILFSRQP